MAVKNTKDGIKKCNRRTKRVEPLVSVKKLKEVYLYGLDINDAEGTPLPDSAYQQYIDNAVSMLEHYLDIAVVPEIDHVEYHDHRYNNYSDWGYFELNNYPVLNVKKIELMFFRSNDGEDISVQEIPHSWIRLQNHDGIIRLIPNAQFAARLQVGATGSFYPELLRADMVPHSWKITYDFGFGDGQIPTLVNHAVALVAAIQALIIGGNLVLGAGIASSSLSLDGLSQSISTTQSAENSAFSATIKEYQALLFGKSQEEAKNAIIAQLKYFYKGDSIHMV